MPFGSYTPDQGPYTPPGFAMNPNPAPPPLMGGWNGGMVPIGQGQAPPWGQFPDILSMLRGRQPGPSPFAPMPGALGGGQPDVPVGGGGLVGQSIPQPGGAFNNPYGTAPIFSPPGPSIDEFPVGGGQPDVPVGGGGNPMQSLLDALARARSGGLRSQSIPQPGGRRNVFSATPQPGNRQGGDPRQPWLDQGYRAVPFGNPGGPTAGSRRPRWGGDASPVDRMLDVYRTNVRKKPKPGAGVRGRRGGGGMTSTRTS